jgi:spermidine/putrescine transport system substrate-binding protein
MKYFLFLLCLLPGLLFAKPNVVNIYNWSNYIPSSVISDFEHETGIHVNYTTYDQDETLYTKLKADPDIPYDVVFPSTYFVSRMAREHMLAKLDLSKLPNWRHLNPLLLHQSYDPKNAYSLPYLWGSSSIIVNTRYYSPKSLTRWQDLWQPRFKNQILLLNDIRDVFSMALISQGDSINTNDPEKIRRAYQKLKSLLPNIKLFNNGATISIFADGDATVGMMLSGDALHAKQENANLHFIYPKDGVILSVDCMTIPINAPHVNNAYRFINYLLRPDIAKRIALSTGYASPNLTAIKLMPKTMQQNPIIYPPKSVMQRAQTEAELSPKAKQLMLRLWQSLKLGA